MRRSKFTCRPVGQEMWEKKNIEKHANSFCCCPFQLLDLVSFIVICKLLFCPSSYCALICHLRSSKGLWFVPDSIQVVRLMVFLSYPQPVLFSSELYFWYFMDLKSRQKALLKSDMWIYVNTSNVPSSMVLQSFPTPISLDLQYSMLVLFRINAFFSLLETMPNISTKIHTSHTRYQDWSPPNFWFKVGTRKAEDEVAMLESIDEVPRRSLCSLDFFPTKQEADWVLRPAAETTRAAEVKSLAFGQTRGPQQISFCWFFLQNTWISGWNQSDTMFHGRYCKPFTRLNQWDVTILYPFFWVLLRSNRLVENHGGLPPPAGTWGGQWDGAAVCQITRGNGRFSCWVKGVKVPEDTKIW